MKKILFDLKKEYYFNSLYPIYKELEKDDNYNIYFNIGKDQKRFLGIFLIAQKNEIAENLISDLKIDSNKKTVLFAPSYKSSCKKYLKQKITDLIPKYNLIIKLHPYSWSGKYAQHSQHRFYEKLALNILYQFTVKMIIDKINL